MNLKSIESQGGIESQEYETRSKSIEIKTVQSIFILKFGY